MITPQDFDRLSAYMDNQLSPAEKAKLESRLAAETELQQALADLRLTRRMLRSLPTIKPPRNFTLTRAQAHARPRFQLFPALRLATALAGFAFIFLLAVDLLALQYSAGGTVTAPQDAALKSTSTETVETLAESAGAEAATEAPPAAYPLAETPTPEMSVAAADASVTPTPDPDVSRSALTVAPTETPLVTAYSFGVTIEGDGTTQPTDESYYAPPELADPTWPVVRYFQIGLGLLTVVLALAAWRWRNH